MGLDYLMARHRISLLRADAALCIEARIAHLGLAAGYARAGAAARLALAGVPHFPRSKRPPRR